VAGRILTDWQYQVSDFVKVMPRDYKRVLQAIKVAEETGVDVDEAIMAAAKG
jgi:glutamate synthase (NADPH/NADH) large chain